MGGSSKKQTVGYQYSLGIHMALCHGPVDKLEKIDIADKTAWEGESTGGEVTINKPELFGGEEREGGVSGNVDMEFGQANQGQNGYLVSRLGSLVPSYRGVVSAILKQVYIGNNPYIKKWSFWLSRIHTKTDGTTQWYDEKAQVGQDMNPAHIIRECLTDVDWGMGYSTQDVDDASFTQAADQLYLENMGMSLLWDKSMEIDEFIGQVLKHIDGALYVDRSSGKFALGLARGGYDVNLLPVYDEFNIQKISNFKRTSVSELTNSVTVIYWDGTTGKNNSVTVQDISLAQAQGTTIGTTIQYPGFTNGDIASRVASRDLKALSTPLASVDLYLNRKASDVNVGDLFILNWPKYGVEQLIMRVSKVELGSLTDNIIKVSAVEDVFGLGDAIYAPPPPTEWAPPSNIPQPSPYHVGIEAPYWELVQRVGETEASSIDPNSGYALFSAVRPTGDSQRAALYSSYSGQLQENGRVEFCPTAVLDASIGPLDTVLPITGGEDIDLVQPGTHANLGDELVIVESISSTTLIISRGTLDTIPQEHLAGTRIFFADEFYESDGYEYAETELVQWKALPITGEGMLEESLAPLQQFNIEARHYKPYPPGKVRINNTPWPTSITSTEDVNVSWAHRDRLQQTASLVGHGEDSIGPEPGTTYELRLETEGGVLISSASGVTTNNHSFTTTEMGTNYGNLVLKLWSVRDGVSSLQTYEITFERLSP